MVSFSLKRLRRLWEGGQGKLMHRSSEEVQVGSSQVRKRKNDIFLKVSVEGGGEKLAFTAKLRNNRRGKVGFREVPLVIFS